MQQGKWLHNEVDINLEDLELVKVVLVMVVFLNIYTRWCKHTC